MRLHDYTVTRLALVAIWMMAAQACLAQQIKADAQLDLDMTGDPIFSHRLYYTGMVEYDGEMIPSFQYSDVYVFNKLIFKNPAQAKKYYKIANNIKKVYPIACDIQRTVDRTIAHMDSLPTKREKDAYLKQQEKAQVSMMIQDAMCVISMKSVAVRPASLYCRSYFVTLSRTVPSAKKLMPSAS